jgi:hypothetical protein
MSVHTIARFAAVVATACTGIAGALTACGFAGEGTLALTVPADGSGAPDGASGPETGAINVEGGVTVEGGGPIEGDAGPCALGDGGAGVLCGGKCVNTARNHENCGGCGLACPKSSACDGACVVVAKTLEGMRYEIPCMDNPLGAFCNGGSPPPAAKTITLKGTTGKSYVIGIRVRGVVEQNSYSGMTAGGAQGTNAAFFVFDGAVTNDNWNTYSLAVSSPAKTAFLNSGATGHAYVDGIDYTARLDANAGATITLSSASIDSLIAKNLDQAGTPIVIPGIPPAPAAFKGQFVQVDVETVMLAP